MTNKTERTPQDAEAVAQARESVVRVLQAAHISCEPSTFYDLAETLGVTFPPTEHQIADALFAAVRVAEVEPCDWHQDSDGLWWTDCGNVFEFNEDGPWMNGLKFCGYCGKKLVEVPYEPMPDDDEEAQP